MKKTLIKSGNLITASETFQADILIEGEKISRIGTDLPLDGETEIIDAAGKNIMPGGVDPHVHLDLPMFDTISSDDHYTGHKAAAFGGTTTVMDFIPQDSADLLPNIEAWQAKAAKAAIDYGFHMNITAVNYDVLDQIPILLDHGITTLKVFMAYNGRLRLKDGEIFRVMRAARQHGMLTMLHAENGDVIEQLVKEALAQKRFSPIWHARTRPSWGAVEAVMRGAALAAQAEAPLYIVHMNAAGEVDQLHYARSRGAPVMGETCPQYLFFEETDLEREDGAKWVCSPPVRGTEDRKRLWQGLHRSELQVIATDHCPFFFDGSKPVQYEGEQIAIRGKELGVNDFTKIPNGLPGVGDRLPILWTYGVRAGHLTPNQFVALTSTNPAKIFGLYPRKGSLLPGSDADIVIWEPDKRLFYGAKHARHRTDYNLYEGWEITGYPEMVFLRGRLIVDDGEWLGQKGGGEYLPRVPGSHIFI